MTLPLQARLNPHFIIPDNSILSSDGHYLAYALAVLNASRSYGYAPVLMAHRAFEASVPDDVEVVRVYRYDNWTIASRLPIVRWLRLRVLRERGSGLPTSARSGASANAGFLGNLRRLHGALDGAIRSQRFARDTTAALGRVLPRSGDVLFLPNPWISELQGLALTLRARPLPERVSIHVLLRREFRDRDAAPFADVLERLTACVSGKRVFFYTDTPELTNLYAGAFGLRFHTLPIPHPLPETAVRKGAASIRVCYVGDARGEKGFTALPYLISRAVEGFKGGRPIKFVIHAKPPATGLERDVGAALKALRAFRSDAVTLVTQGQTRAEYERTIADADVVMLPYTPQDYRHRSSGVLIEALTAGRPVIVPDGTWLANELRRFRQTGHPSVSATDGLAGVVYTPGDDIGERLLYVLRHLEAFQTVARACAPKVREQHNADRLVQILTTNAQSET